VEAPEAASIIAVPYDSGHVEARMGRGPGTLISGGLERALRTADRAVCTTVIGASGHLRTENATGFELMRLVSERVRDEAGSGAFPLVLSGNCNASVGTVAGLGPAKLGVVWFDGHPDFNTPETTRSAFLDGMGLAIMTGDCWAGMAGTIPGFEPVPEENLVLVGTRDAGAEERERLASSAVTVVEPGVMHERGVRDTLCGPLDALRERVTRVYVHLDLDVLDPDRVAPANGLAPPDGLVVDEVQRSIRHVAERFTITSAGIASYDPSFDQDGEVLRAGIALAGELVGGAASSRLR